MDDEAPPPPAPAPPPASRTGRIARYLFTRTLGLAVIALALLALGVHLLDTGPGRRLVSDMVGSYEFANGVRVEIGRIEGSIYGDMVLHDLSVKDPRGEFLWSPEVRVGWRPFAWLRDHVDVREVAAQRLVLRRLPALRPTPPSTEPLLPDLTIDLGSLRIARLVMEPAVTGVRREASLAGSAHIADRRAQVRLDLRSLRGAGNAGGDAVALLLDAVPERNRLAMDLTLDAPRDGLIAVLSGLREPLAVRLRGHGDWARWDGLLAANLGGGELARLALGARDGTFTLKGPARLSRLVSGTPSRLLGPQSTIDLAAALDQRRAGISGSVASDTLRLDAKGVVDLGESRFEGLKLGLLLLRPAALAENLAARDLRADLVLDGAFVRPEIAYVASAARLAFGDTGIEGLVARGAARVDPDRVLIPVAARAARITGLDTVAGGALADVRLDGDLAVKGARIMSDNMRIRSTRIDGTAILLADLSRGTYASAIDGRFDDYRIESVGLFAGETDARLESLASGGFALTGKLRVRSRRLDSEGVRDFLGGNLLASADVRYGPDGVVRFGNLRMQAPLARITGGEGSFVPGGAIALRASAITRRYGPVALRLAGTLARPEAWVRAERPGLGIGLANLEARVTGMGETYRFDLTGDTDYGPLSGDVAFNPASGALHIARGDLSGIGFSGDLARSRAGPFVGTLAAKGNGLDGVVRLGEVGGHQEALVNLRARGTVLPGAAGLTIGTAIVDARVVLYDRPHVVADVQVAGTRWRGVNWNAARVIVDYRDGSGKAKALLEGTAAFPFRVAVNADLTPRLWRAALSGRARGVDFRTASPARIVPGGDGYELLPTRLSLGQGDLRVAGFFGDAMRIESRFTNLDVGLINAFVPGYGIGGRASGSLDFAQAGPSAFPRADARLSITGFTRTTASSISQPVEVNFVGKLLADGGDARAVFRQRGAVIGRLAASLRPLPPGGGTWTQRLMGAPLGGGIRYNGPAETLHSLVGQADQRLSGPLGLAADFSCRVSDPCLKGIVRGKGLTYENQRYGTKLTQIEVEGRFNDDRIELDKLVARAGAGTLSGSGYLSLAAAAGYPMDLTFRLDDARVARGDLLSARATGDLRLTKKAGELALLSGELRLPETRYKIVRQGAAEVPQLTGVRFARASGAARVSGDEPAPPSTGLFDKVRIDIAIVAPERLYVTGMGLESEWKARFRVTGTSAAPEIVGSVDLLRGTLGFAGRSFELTEGRIGFPGGKVTNPTLAVVASDDIEDITVRVNVTGRAFNPRIAFSSVPGLPQDEILARVLFGDSIANLSTLQAVQLAASLNSLRGSGGGLNPLGKLRSATGIDRLRILGPDEATGRGTTLAAGQYITNDIYVELITDARGFTATQLEISITPWLSLLSQAGGSGVNAVNLRVKKNY